jgi:hypothetical protein
MKKTFLYALIVGILSITPLGAQTILPNTTLAAALNGTSRDQLLTVASATNINAPSPQDVTKQTYLYIDREAVEVRAVNGTSVSVIRGVSSTTVAAHKNGAVVFVIPASLTLYTGGRYGDAPGVPQGSCTRSNELVLPRIQFQSGMISDCLGGQWVTGDMLQTSRTTNSLLRSPEPGATALTALETAGTAAAAATEIYCTEVTLPYSMLLTGAAVLNGTTVGTNKHFIILYDSSGNVLANSAVAGTTTAGASVYQKLNFVSKYLAVGPNRYFVCDGLNGTTDTIRHAITAVNDNIIGGAVTGQVFGTAAAVTLPTTFTTAKAPYVALF